MQELTFGNLLKKYRQLAGFKTLKQLVDALTDEGLIYSESLVSRWQKDSRLPRDRGVFLILIKIFISHKAIKNIYQANQLLSSAGMGYLSPQEVKSVLINGGLELEMNLYLDNFAKKDKEKSLVKVYLTLPKNLDRYLDWISDQYKTNKLEIIK